RGRVRVRGRVETEELKNGKTSLIVREIPYQLNKSSLIEKIALLVKEKKITGIVDLRDESDRDGIRIVIELKKGEEPELILNKLYKYTELQNTFGIIMLALVNNVPKVLTLKEILEEYLKHRFEVVTRRTQFDLDKAEKRAHLLQGFRTALDNIDRIIEIIRGSLDGSRAKEQLIEKYMFSEAQAKAILDMRLQRLTGLERDKIENEFKDLEASISEFTDILANDNRIYEIIKEELEYLKEKYADDRKTSIENERLEILPEDLIKDEQVIVTVTNRGYVKRIELNKYKAQKRGGKGVSTQNTVEDDYVESIEAMSNLDTMMIFTNQGRVFNLKVYQIPETSKQARGRLISNLVKLRDDEKVRAIIKTRDFSDKNEVIFVTRDGTVKKTNLSGFKNINVAGLKAIKLKDDDDIIFVGLVPSNEGELFIATKFGNSIRFKAEEIRSQGRDTTGVRGVKLKKDDSVVSALLVGGEDNTVLTVTENGYGKRTRIDEYPLQGRAGLGVINLRCNSKTGDVVAVMPVHQEGEELMAITSSGVVIRTPMSSISIYGRATQGVKIMRTDDHEKLVSITKVVEENEDTEE
ncbi:MAG: DNA gyrase C-terminal beta-propeller domain-containing protein, partial [Cetobacterium sp.]